jgi:hypothetical protein
VGLYLCVFASDDTDEELDGIDVGGYDDFHDFRQAVSDKVEAGQWASTFPRLMNHPDSDGEWTPGEAALLIGELGAIQKAFEQLPPEPASGWRAEAIRMKGLPQSLADCFVDVDGEPLLERMVALAKLCADRKRPIIFQ